MDCLTSNIAAPIDRADGPPVVDGTTALSVHINIGSVDIIAVCP